MRRVLTAITLTTALLAGCATPNAATDAASAEVRDSVRPAAVAEANFTAYIAIAGVT